MRNVHTALPATWVWTRRGGRTWSCRDTRWSPRRLDVIDASESGALQIAWGYRRAEHCTHPNQNWCDCDWCRVVRDEQLKSEPCECGNPGRHPYPIGGAWALACDECKEAAIQEAAVGMPGEGATAEEWTDWHLAATGKAVAS